MKFFLISILFFTISNAKPLLDIYSVDVSKGDNFKNLKIKEGFKKVKLPLVMRDKLDNIWIKIDIKNLKGKDEVLKLSSALNLNSIIIDESIKKYLIDTNTIFIDEALLDEIYFKILNSNGVINISADIYSKDGYNQTKQIKTTVFGIAMGIPITAFFYYMFFYFFNRKKSFLYYALTQVFSTTILVSSQFPFYQEHVLCYFTSAFFAIFSLLFTQSFLETKKYTPLMHKFYNILIVLFMLDPFIKITNVFPIFLFISIYPISGIIVYLKSRQKQILFFIVAWSLIGITFASMIIDIMFINFLPSYINFIDILFITIPLESIILALGLSYMIKLSEDEKKEKEKLLIHQNKLASIGEMINNIAHQWRQPLTHLSYILMNITKAHSVNKLDENYLKVKNEEATEQLEYMSSTIDIFKNFYTPKTTKSDISVKEEVSNTLQIISASLSKEDIDIEVLGEDFSVYGYSGELSQVLLNIISNARDAFVSNKIYEGKVKISLEPKTIKIKDNAGGIDKGLKSDIFSPYFTTKLDGSGIGLYMSKIIIEKHFQGKVFHENIKDGSLFIIDLDKN